MKLKRDVSRNIDTQKKNHNLQAELQKTKKTLNMRNNQVAY